MTFKTCTKVNIGLNVLRRRPDGYHDLETLFVPYWGLGDELSVEPAEELSIDIQREGGVDWDPMEDLTVRAWRLLKADFPSLPEVSIRLVKGAPVGAGLGGGSADAAFMLRALNELGGLCLSDSELAVYAARLGSDCAFFVGTKNVPTIPLHPLGTGGVPPETPLVADAPFSIGPKFATGRGEILEPFDIDLSGYDLRVELPLDAATGRPVAVSTKEAYSGIVPRDARCMPATPPMHARVGQVPDSEVVAENRLCHYTQSAFSKYQQVNGLRATGGWKLPLREALKLPVEQWRGVVVNDFEATVCPRHPQISELIEDFYRRGAAYSAMSGSGSAVFGLFPHH